MPGEGRGNRTNHPRRGSGRTIQSLRLDVESANAGKTWLLLPDGFRDTNSGKVYPLPSNVLDLQKLITIPIPPGKRDDGCVYIRRAIKAFRKMQLARQSALLDTSHRSEKIAQQQKQLQARISHMKSEVREAVEEVRSHVGKAIAGLNDLFELGKKGMDAQMRAHLEDREYQGEKISAKAFRDCFRMVTQAVKGFGVPSTAPAEAREAVMDEVAKALKDTQEAVSLAPGSKDPEIVN